jgi:hypothetical protein
MIDELRPGQVWRVDYQQVTVEGVLLSIWGRGQSKELILPSQAVGSPWMRYDHARPVWDFCGFSLTEEEARALFISQVECVSARCIFDPYALEAAP